MEANGFERGSDSLFFGKPNVKAIGEPVLPDS